MSLGVVLTGGAISVEPPVEVTDVAAGSELLDAAVVEGALVEVAEAALDVEAAELDVGELVDELDGAVDVEEVLAELELLVEAADVELLVDVVLGALAVLVVEDVVEDDDVELEVVVGAGGAVFVAVDVVGAGVEVLVVLLGALVVVLGATTLMLANAPLWPAARVHPTWAM